VPVAAVATYSLVNPVVAMALGAVVLGERIDSSAIAASALVLAGVALVLWPAKAQPAPKLAEPAPSLSLERAS